MRGWRELLSATSPPHEWELELPGKHTTYVQHNAHRRRKRTEEKAKVVAVVWWTEIMQFLAALALLHYDDFVE